MSPLIVIPARLAATRLPGKPLLAIAGRPLILHVLERAQAAGIGPVAVACSDAEIAQAVEAAGGRAVVTEGDHASGSDRVREAADRLDPDRRHDVVINVQGDMPTLDPAILPAVMEPLADPAVDIATPACPIEDARERDDPGVVKIAAECDGAIGSQGRALYFSRNAIPSGDGPMLHHIGIYAFRRAALDRFVALPPSRLEGRERLEQLRALAAGMHIAIKVVAGPAPFGVDLPADLDRARAVLGGA